jgi:hypothetical protein
VVKQLARRVDFPKIGNSELNNSSLTTNQKHSFFPSLLIVIFTELTEADWLSGR